MSYPLKWAALPNKNKTATLHISNAKLEITKHITDADNKGPFFSIQTFIDNKPAANNVTFGDTQEELNNCIDEILQSIER